MTSFNFQNIAFKINEFGQIRNLTYDKQEIIKEINLIDYFYPQLTQITNTIEKPSYFHGSQNIYQFAISKIQKNKRMQVFLKPLWNKKNHPVMISLLITIEKNQILIENRYYATRQKIVWGLTNEIILNDQCSFKVPDLKVDTSDLILKWTIDNYLIIKARQNEVKLQSSYGSFHHQNQKFAFSPLLTDKKSILKRAWTVKKNNRNFYVLKLNFNPSL